MTFEDIQRANAQIVTTNIKGKEYAEVNQRIKAFRMLYPTGSIETTLLSDENGVCIMFARVGYYDPETGAHRTLGTGTAYEKESSSYINKTSYIENCETSAVGRALGMAGFGIDTSVASFEEVSNAIAQQEAEKRPERKKANNSAPKVEKAVSEPSGGYTEHITEKDWNVLKAACKSADMSTEELLERYQIAKPSDITYATFYDMLDFLS